MFYTFMPYEKLISCEKYYDEKASLLYMPVSQAVTPINKHFSGYAHHISESLDYALWLLYTDAENNFEKAKKIIQTATKYQCTDKNSSAFGYWRYFSENKLSDIVPDDASLNCRIAITLLHIYTDYGSFFDEQFLQTINEKILNSVYTLLTKYTSQNSFTIALSIYLSVTYGEMTEHLEFIKQGENMLVTLYNSVMYHNSFYEHNDMQHIVDQTVFFHQLSQTVKSKYHRRLLNTILDKTWQIFATHYHPETKQISGPFALAVSDYTTPEIYNFLYHALGESVDLPHYSSELAHNCPCPPKYMSRFKTKSFTGFLRSVVFKGMTSPYFRHSIVESNYIKKSYTVGSFSREHFWELKRPFIGYFSGANTPYCFKIDVLHDFFSYSSALLHSIQYYGYVFGHISFATDSGDTHLMMDAPNPSISAKDLRIRFSISGDIRSLKIKHRKNTLEVSYNDVTMYYQIPVCQFGDSNIKYKLSTNENNLYMDVILYSGRRKTIDFTALESAIMQFSFLITSTGKEPAQVQNSIENEALYTKTTINNLTFELKTLIKPNARTVTLVCDEQSVNDIPLETYVTQLTEQVQDITFLENKKYKHTSYFPFLSNDEETSRIIGLIGNLVFFPLSSLQGEVKHILEQIENNSYSLDLYKRLSIQIVINIFESIKRMYGKFNDVIDKKHSSIYQRIITSVTTESIADEIIMLCQAIEEEEPYFTDSGKNDSLSVKMLRLVRENLLSSDLSLAYLAEKLGCSIPRMSRLFLKVTGMKYSEYIQQEKINYAISKLSSEKITITAVSEMLGYTSPNNFTRMFKKVTGMTVSQYLRQL